MIIRAVLAVTFLAFLTGLPVSAEVAPAELNAISIPDKVETSIGTLEFFDGVPTDATVEALYDNLDRMRAVEVYLNNQGAASLNAMRAGNASIGADSSNKVTISE